jgi:lipopolysaccharide biosynthesis glycosyltransferase
MKTAIVTSFDKNYLIPSMVSLKSLSSNYHGKDKLDIVCLVSPDVLEMKDEYIAKLKANNLNIDFRCSTKFIEMVDSGLAHSSNHISSHCNHRIFLGSILADYDKAIYIDSDIVVCRDISPLIKFPMRNKLMAMAEYNSMNVITFNDPDRPYFNNGVFIVDLNYWRDSDAEQSMLRFIEENGPTTCPEQDAMNHVFIDVWSPLPFSFNSFHYWMTSMPIFAKNNTNPIIVHFVGPHKPWNGNGTEWEHGTEWEKLWHVQYLSIFGKFLTKEEMDKVF